MDVVIVAFHAHDSLCRCLESLAAHPPRDEELRVVVVDNGRDAETPNLVRRILPSAETVDPGGNVGFARATNLGIRRGSDAHVLILNPDAEICSGTLDSLLTVLDEREDVAMVGPELVREDGSLDHAARRSFPTPLSALGHFTGVGRRLRGGPLAEYRAPGVTAGRVDAVNGAFMLCRRAALDEVGLFDEGYWMYMEDLDLCYRLRQEGWLTWYEPAARALHVKHGTSGALRSPRLVWAFHYGMYRFYRTHYAPQRSRTLSALVYAGIGLRGGGVIAASLVARALLRVGKRSQP